MFTGIVEELGTVVGLTPTGGGATLRVRGAAAAGSRPGESLAVDGVCLTVAAVADGAARADVLAETLRRTTLGALRPGDAVNLERPVPVTGRLGGHLVQGHVDGVGRVLRRDGELLEVGLPAGLARYLAVKGSVAVDGVSLTVVSVTASSFAVALIPETLGRTTLGRRAVGAAVNLEVDVIAKYVERLLEAHR